MRMRRGKSGRWISLDTPANGIDTRWENSVGLSFKITRDDVSPALGRMARAARNPVAVFRAMGTTFKSITEGTFNSVGARFRPKSWPALKDPPGKPSILQRSTTMAKAFHLEVTSTYARVSNPMVYAAIHQVGGVIKPKAAKRLTWVGSDGQKVFASKVTIPARPFYPVTADGKLTPEAERLIARAGERAIERQKDKG
jgi:phage gpG-like protein